MTDTTKKPARARKINASAKVKASAQETPKVAAAPKVKVNPHVEKGVDFARYEGPSKGNNGLRPVKIMIKDGVTSLTDRARKNLYALRDEYKGSEFEAKGIDNGILRDLLAAGLIEVSGGQKATIDGKPYIVDGPQPVKVKFNAAGQKYGTA